MDLLTIIRIVFRRWYVTVPILIVTMVVAFAVQSATPPQYAATGTVMLEEPQFDPSRLPTSVVNSSVLIDRFEAAGALNEVVVGGTRLVPQISDMSSIELLAGGDDPGDVAQSVERAMEWLASEAEALQDEHEIWDDERLRPVILTPRIATEQQPDGGYQATGVIALRDPAAGTGNPFSAGGATTSVLQAVLTSDAGRERVNERTVSGVGFTLSTARDNAAIIDITTTGSDRQGVLEGFEVVADVLAEELDARQARAEVPTSRRLEITVLAAPARVVDTSPPLSRAVAAVVALGGLLALGAAIAVDGVVARRRSRTGAEPGTVDPLQATDSWWSETSLPDHGTSGPSQKATSGPERGR